MFRTLKYPSTISRHSTVLLAIKYIGIVRQEIEYVIKTNVWEMEKYKTNYSF